MPTVNCSPLGPKPQIELAAGTPAVGYKLFFYVAGSVNTKQSTYTDSTGSVANTNPLVLNSLGQPATEIWFTSGQTYKVVLATSTDTDPPTSPVWSIDNLRGINDTTSTVDQWITGPTPTFAATTQFTLAGDQTSTFHVNRRLKFTVTAGTVYGRITASTYAALTTVTVAMDGSQVLDSGLSAVFYGILSNNVLSIPSRTAAAAGTDTYTATVGASQYVTFDEYRIKITNANTITTPTLNLDGLGAKTIVTQSGAAVAVGNLNGEHLFRYNGTNMVVLNPVPIAAVVATNFGAAIRQTVSGGPIDSSGFPNLGGTIGSSSLTTSGISVSVPLAVTSAAGFDAASGKAIDYYGFSTSNLTWTGLTTNGTMYLFVDVNTSTGALTTGSTTLAPVYQFGGTYSTTNLQNTYNIQDGLMKVGNGATASQVQRVFVGEVTVAANVVSAILWYAYNGRYQPGFTATLPGTTTTTTFNHNLGTYPGTCVLELECTSAEFGFAVGDRLVNFHTNNGANAPMAYTYTAKTAAFTTGNTNAVVSTNRSTGGNQALTAANWKFRMTAYRGW